jgi:hypothetical protein
VSRICGLDVERGFRSLKPNIKFTYSLRFSKALMKAGWWSPGPLVHLASPTPVLA